MTKKFSNTYLFAIFSFFILCLLAAFRPYFSFDLTISRDIQLLNFPLFDFFMRFLSSLGNTPYFEILVGILIFYFVSGGKLMESFLVLYSVAGSATLGYIFKILVHRPRPAMDLVNVQSILKDGSFPSGHVLVFTSLFGFLFYMSFFSKKKYIRRLTQIIAPILIIFISFSRIYLGVHWASDTLGGYLLGLIFLLSTISLYRYYRYNSTR